MEHDERNMLNFSDGQKINMTIPERIGKFLSCIEKLLFVGRGGEQLLFVSVIFIGLSVSVLIKFYNFIIKFYFKGFSFDW